MSSEQTTGALPFAAARTRVALRLAAALPMPLRLALRELRGGLKGFYVFVACVALGVAVIAGVGALGDTLRGGLERQGLTLLGGDVALARPHARARDDERAWLNAHAAGGGRLSETATLRAMARRTDATEQVLVELKGVDRAYPLAGELKLAGETDAERAMHTGAGAAVDAILLERLGLQLGDKLVLGTSEVAIRATIAAEPDKISDRLTFGPRVLVSLATLEASGLAEPGSLIRWRYALLLPPGARADTGLVRFRDAVKAGLPEGGFTVADRRDPSPSVTRTLDRLRQFLTLIGLTTLLVGGVGVANAVATYIDRRRSIIATMKSLGATGRVILAVHLAQVMSIAGIGVAIGLVAGMAVPIGLMAAFGEALPLQADLALRPASLLLAAAYGFLVSLVFTLWPLGRAELVRAGVLFREEVAPERVWPRWPVIAATLGAAAALAALAVLTSDARRIALYFCLGVVGVFAVFMALGWLVTSVARRLPRSRRPALALAIGGIGAPGGLTRSVVLSLGAGLTLLVGVALVHASLIKELTDRLPEQSPSYFVIDLPRGQLGAYRELVRGIAPEAILGEAPMLRGRVVALGERPAESIKAAPEAQWVLRGDRGLSYADTVPEGSRVVQGEWWAKDYAGPPLVSFEADLAKGLGVKLGDRVTVNVLGRNVTATVANLREVKWESLAINFVMVFSPNTLKAAPHNLLATVTLSKTAPLEQDARLAREIAKAFPTVSTIRVRDAINAFNAVFAKVMTAVRVAGGVTLLAGALVLAGAMATAQRRRTKQAVILRVLGATRRQILTQHALEYAILAAATGAIALALGTLTAWLVLSRVMDVELAFSWSAVAEAMAVAVGLIAVFGGVGTARVLSARAVPHLRAG